MTTDPRAPGLVAIITTGRSGSTLLTGLMDGSPGVYVHPVEINFLAAMDDLALLPVVRTATVRNASKRGLNRLSRRIPTRRLLRYYQSHWHEIETVYLSTVEGPISFGPHPSETLAKRHSYTPAEFVPAFLGACGAWLGGGQSPTHCVFKTLETPYVADYERLFPEMRFIHLLRDPVGSWASLKRTSATQKMNPLYRLGGENFSTHVECRWMSHAQAVVSRLGHPRHHVIRYEELIANPVAEVGAVMTWLGFTPPPELDLQTALGGKRMRKMVVTPSQGGVEAPERVVADLGQRFKYEEVVSDRERDLIRLRTWDIAAKLGYPADGPLPSPEMVARAWKGADKWDFVHVHGAWSTIKALAAYVRRRRYVARVIKAARHPSKP